MARTLVDINEAALAAAMAELGTTTKIATVNAALVEVVALRRRLALLDHLAEHSDLGNPDVMAAAWR